MNNQKGFTPIVIVLIVVALLAGGFFAWQYWRGREPVAEDETAIKKYLENKTYCEEDSDCVLVEACCDSCGNKFTQVNKYYAENIKDISKEERCKTEIAAEFGLGCPVYRCRTDFDYTDYAVICKNNQCEKQYNETTDWKIYKNSRYNYLIKYPKNWHINTENSEADFTKRGGGEDVGISYIGGDTAWSNYPFLDYTPDTVPADIQIITLMVYKVDVNESIKNFLEKNYEFLEIVEGKKFITNTGEEGEQYIFQRIDPPSYDKSIGTFFKKEDKIYVIFDSERSKDIYNKMLSTFRFLE